MEHAGTFIDEIADEAINELGALSAADSSDNNNDPLISTRREMAREWSKMVVEDREAAALALQRIARLQASVITKPGPHEERRLAIKMNLNALDFMAARYQIKAEDFARKFVADVMVRWAMKAIDLAL